MTAVEREGAAPVLSYGFSLAGRSHEGSGAPCQDAHLIRPLPGGWTLAAVSDGVGSAPRSDEGAALALEALADHCTGALAANADQQALLRALRRGFFCAEQAVAALAERAGRVASDYDATLTAVLYNGSRALVGHCGDGGVIGLDCEGHQLLLTCVQKGELWNEVVPLRAGAGSWQFFAPLGNWAGLLLLTDGLLDVACPDLLAGQGEPLYRAFVHRFLSGALTAAGELCTAQQQLCDFVRSPDCAAITDDVTAVALLRSDPPAPHPGADYLAEPDWQALRQERYFRLYPQLRPQPEQPEEEE